MRRRYRGRPPRRQYRRGVRLLLEPRGPGSVYTRAQFEDWFRPIDPAALVGKSVLELGFGNGSLLFHVGACRPARLVGVELGDTLARTRTNLAHLPPGMLELHRGDLTEVSLGRFDYVYCIGVLHHLARPREGFDAVLRHTRTRRTLPLLGLRGGGERGRDPPRRAHPTRRLAPAVVGHEVRCRAPADSPVLRLREGAPTHPEAMAGTFRLDGTAAGLPSASSRSSVTSRSISW